jgi:hypothetical protein
MYLLENRPDFRAMGGLSRFIRPTGPMSVEIDREFFDAVRHLVSAARYNYSETNEGLLGFGMVFWLLHGHVNPLQLEPIIQSLSK